MAKSPEAECPHCGEFFPRGRSSCPHCGSDQKTGWKSDEEVQNSSVDLNFTSLGDADYEAFLSTEGLDPARRKTGSPSGVDKGKLAAYVLVAMFTLALLVELLLRS